MKIVPKRLHEKEIFLNEMAYGPFVFNLNLSRFLDMSDWKSAVKHDPTTRESLKKLAISWKHTVEDDGVPNDLMALILKEPALYPSAQKTMAFIKAHGEMEQFRRKVAWIQAGFDSGEFLKY